MAYDHHLKQIEALALSDEKKSYLENRWLDQYAWFERRAKTMQMWYRRLRLIVVIGGVLIPSLIGIKFSPDIGALFGLRDQPVEQEPAWVSVASGLTDGVIFIISLIVAIAAALEEFFNFGEKHRNYRKTAEAMKGEYWQFLLLSGHYSKYQDDAMDYAQSIKAAYGTFVQRIEQIIEDDVRSFIELVDEQMLEDNRQTQKMLQDKTDGLMSELKHIGDRLAAIEGAPAKRSPTNPTAAPSETPDTSAAIMAIDLTDQP
ncbi:hypothetical protein BH23CYA1_BH23CYA1_19080 [soil metagenome]